MYVSAVLYFQQYRTTCDFDIGNITLIADVRFKSFDDFIIVDSAFLMTHFLTIRFLQTICSDSASVNTRHDPICDCHFVILVSRGSAISFLIMWQT